MTAASFGQQRLWFLDRMSPGSAAYNVPMALRLTGLLDPSQLAQALDRLVARHDSLRTVFREEVGVPIQVVLPARPVELPVLDVSEIEARRRIEDEARQPFDLSTGPLLRARLFRIAADDHFFVITMHHIVSDGWSLTVLLDELGAEQELPELEIQFADFAQWQREQVAGPVGARQLDYWVRQLNGAPMLLELPLDHPRPEVQSFRGASHSFALPSKDLRTLSRSLRTTTFMTLLAAFQALLSRYSGQNDVVVGTEVSGRSRRDAERLIGFFVNTVPLRTSLAGNPTFRELVSRVQDTVLDGIDNGDLPFERVVEAVAPERSLGHLPVYQVSFAMPTAPDLKLTLPGVSTAESWLVPNGTTKSDLGLSAVDLDDRLHLELEYDADLFDPSTIERFAEHLITLLTAVVADPDRPIRDVPLLTEVSHRQRRVPETSASVLDMFADQVLLDPGAVAVESADGSLTYGELDARANQLAHMLRAHGVGPEAPVALCLERSTAMVVGMLAVWKAGGAYLPIDLSWPVDRQRFVLSDAGARIALVDEDRFADLDQIFPTEASDQPTTSLEPLHCADNLAYLIYTSGSTGRPKGVAVPHRGVANLLTGSIDLLDVSSSDVWASPTSIAFDASVQNLLQPLVTGAKVIVLTTAEIEDPVLLRRRLDDSGATVLDATPSFWRILLTAGPLPERLSLRLCGGEALSRDLADLLLADGSAVWNLYGPTEITVTATTDPVLPSPALVELGTPVGDTQVYVLDESMRQVPIGVVGEVYIGGIGVTRGYVRRPGLTAERFVPDPFGDRPGARLYATGDLARRRSGGLMDFLGRIDDQVKIRGYRIELGEIEAALLAHDLVTAAVVLATQDQIVAYVVSSAPERELRDHVAQRLPTYMIPAAVVVLEELPLNSAGKVDRAALPKPDWTQESDRLAPRTPAEHTLVQMWQELLGAEGIGVHDDFFTLGGHSLLAARLLARVRDHFQIDVPVRALFKARTVAAFAEVVERQGAQR